MRVKKIIKQTFEIVLNILGLPSHQSLTRVCIFAFIQISRKNSKGRKKERERERGKEWDKRRLRLRTEKEKVWEWKIKPYKINIFLMKLLSSNATKRSEAYFACSKKWHKMFALENFCWCWYMNYFFLLKSKLIFHFNIWSTPYFLCMFYRFSFNRKGKYIQNC